MHLAGHDVRAAPSYAECMASRPAKWIADTLATGVTQPAAPRPERLRRGRLDLVAVADVVLASLLFGISNVLLLIDSAGAGTHHPPLVLILVSAVLCAPLALRNFYPLGAWSASAIGLFWTTMVFPPHPLSSAPYLPAGVIVYILCLYAVAVRCKPWVVVVASIVTLLLAAKIGAQTGVVILFGSAVAVFVGVIVHSRRGSREQLEVAERRHEGERALLQERQRIARELHDVVAHHMSVIAIQAEAAPYKVADPPPELAESFAEIRASALSGLKELRRVLGVLRSDGPVTVPQPGLDDLGVLLESARSGGVTVEADVSGTPRPLPEGVDLSAYRIVQEALSNAMRHAPGAAVRVNLDYGDAVLKIEVRNSGGAHAAPDAWARRNGDGPGQDGGHGIIGMRERAAMLGGDLTVGPAGDGEFLVSAALPVSPGHLEDTK
jgi:signal transduction histidine kinase